MERAKARRGCEPRPDHEGERDEREDPRPNF
jgi:hypothetical protein